MRRAQRLIEKRDLQAALKYGIREVSYNQRGQQNWKITFADIVYITDSTLTREITSWSVPGAGLDVEMATITAEMRRSHTLACNRIAADPAWWTSHTVVVVDQSGSMRKTDVAGGVTRSDAVWTTLALDFIAKRIEEGEASSSDVISVVCMHAGSTILVDRQPTDWLLYNRVVELLRSCEPSFDGNYLPALDIAENLLQSNKSGGCALMLFFLSDGKPSDRVPPGSSGVAFKLCILAHVQKRIDALASCFGRRLTVSTVGFAGPAEDFCVLEHMASRATQFGSCGQFRGANLSAESLSNAFASLSTSLTATRLELSDSHGKSRVIRDVRREARDTVDDFGVTVDDWYSYRSPRRMRYSVDKKGWVQIPLQTGTAVGVAFRKCYFGEGAERLVRKFREVGPAGDFVGPHLVAKEGRFNMDFQHGDLNVDFHKGFCETQIRAQKLASRFNSRLALLPGVNAQTPRIQFLDCSVYLIWDTNLGHTGVLVEKQLDQLKYKKWNDNAGLKWNVDGRAEAAVEVAAPALEAIMEEDEDDEGAEAEASSAYSIQVSDIPQAFSHFTYRYTNRRMLVCDLQGVFNPGSYCPTFECTDPVIHYRSKTGRKNVFGRTDRGKKGVHDFFKTHECTELCRMLNRRWIRRAEQEQNIGLEDDDVELDN